MTANFGQGYRFPTVNELYQIVSTGPTFFVPNPNLKPEDAISEELAVTRKFSGGFVRLSFFNENDLNALISQTNFVSGQSPTTLSPTSIQSETLASNRALFQHRQFLKLL